MKSHCRVLEKYQEGRLTPTGLILETLALPEEEMIDEILASLPQEVRTRFSLFVDTYSPDTVIVNGPRPRDGAVLHAREWLSQNGNGHLSGTLPAVSSTAGPV